MKSLFRKQIMLRFGVKTGSGRQSVNERPKSSRIVKAIVAIAFHILLHIVSVHLAVAYPLFHVVEHRHGIFSPIKKLLLRNNTNHKPVQLIPSIQAVPLAA